MDTVEPCSICGCTQTDLVDGFYYCAECGTQDTNVRETLIEFSTLGDGILAQGSRKRITKVPKVHEVQMTDDWYKWHSLNFLLNGLADELIEVGAAPSFKTKLLWVWTRYMKKYQNKADFGLANEEQDENENDNPTMNDKPYSSDEEYDDEDEISSSQKSTSSFEAVTKISMPLVIALLYVALNLDKSQIQLAHLLRFMKEGRISINQWQKLVPAELRAKKLKRWLFLDHQRFRYSYTIIRILAMKLFRNLDLGNPIVPDLRPLIDEYLQELCLPNDMKPLVISLMHSRSFDYLDVNVDYKDVLKIPSYELHVMCHILCALKICFSLDDNYEVDLSDAVEKINDIEEHPRSYNSQPTERLFSFKEWCDYITFRKTVLRTHTLHLGAPNYFDMNDYVAFEHQRDRPDYNVTLEDEIAMEVVKKIPRSDVDVIPRNEFIATQTPHSDYTRTIAEYQQDPKVKQLLSEDFTQYSLKYIMKDMFLVDPDSDNPKNILTGVCENSLLEFQTLFYIKDTLFVYPKDMVYVKDCDNHNWKTTLRPQLEHVIKADNKTDSDEKENDHGYESNSECSQNAPKTSKCFGESSESSDFANDKVNINNDLNLKSVIDIEMEQGDASMILDDTKNIHEEIKVPISADEHNGFFKIREEDEGENIFDDIFADLDAKIEEENEPEHNDNEIPCAGTESFSFPHIFQYDVLSQDYRSRDRDSDSSSEDSIRLNPVTLDRDETIKKLVIHACNKLKVSLPGKYIHVTKKTPAHRPRVSNGIKRTLNRGGTVLTINNLISAYNSHLEHDVLHQMSNMVQSAIADFNKTKEESEMLEESEEPPQIDDGADVVNDQTMENETNNTTEEPEPNETIAEDQYNLFAESSDGETYAEDLLPKKNPNFDEETHDPKQLYIKPVEDLGVPDMTLDPKLLKIVDKQIEADNNGSLEVPEKVINKSDSEEEISLSTLQEQKMIHSQLIEQAKCTKARSFKRLIPGNVPSYKYWIRHYKCNLLIPVRNQKFANEMDATMPKSFVLILKECADIVGYSPFNVYMGLQRVEGFLKDKYVNRKRFNDSYSEKNKKKKKHSEF